MKSASVLVLTLVILTMGSHQLFASEMVEGRSVKEFKVALLGDTQAGAGFASVLKMVVGENPDAIMINGDLGYGSSPEAWRDRLLSVVDIFKIPVIGTMGNHDVGRTKTKKYISIFNSFRNSSNELDTKCTGIEPISKRHDVVAVNEVCSFGNITVVGSAIGQRLGLSNDFYEKQLDKKLNDAPADNWKLVGYHYTVTSMNPGIKGNNATYKFFDIIRQHGAIGAQAHTHTAMASCPIISPFKSGDPVHCHPDFVDLESRFVAPGIGLYVDSSISGKDLRPRGRCVAGTERGCGHMVDLVSREGYTRVDGIKSASANKFGAIFFVFNVDGDPNKALGYFKSIDGRTVFRFNVER